jgi:electron transfer flavoprotein beta subunit
MKAKCKPLYVKLASDFGIDLTARTNILKVEPPKARQTGIIVGSIEDLVKKLKNEARVIS